MQLTLAFCLGVPLARPSITGMLGLPSAETICARPWQRSVKALRTVVTLTACHRRFNTNT